MPRVDHSRLVFCPSCNAREVEVAKDGFYTDFECRCCGHTWSREADEDIEEDANNV